jgi:hypothetical protein
MKIDLSPDETLYLLGLLKAHLDYYRLLAGTPKFSGQSRAQLMRLEALAAKLDTLPKGRRCPNGKNVA